jgi:hypothetical protein
MSATGGGAGFTVSFGGATTASFPPWFFVTLDFLAGGLLAPLRFLVCASAVPVANATTSASKHTLIKCFFISLVLFFVLVIRKTGPFKNLTRFPELSYVCPSDDEPVVRFETRPQSGQVFK